MRCAAAILVLFGSWALMMLTLGRFFDWREALVIVKPETFVKWHRTAFRMF